MAAFLYFEEKVHKKKLQRADVIPLLFPRLLCQILEHLGYPTEPQLERKRICREVFTLDKWNNMTAIELSSQSAYSQLLGEHPHDTYLRSILTQQITALSAHQEQIIATQTQHTAIRRRIQHHLGIISPPEHSIPIPPEPSQAPPIVHQTMHSEEPTTGEAEAAEPSSPHHTPATI
ncbi:hypothetical protein CK203_101319 [Vitis vinifera]|uniref:Uncharacterized protein n=1 Tax=Vitis vinifera TaxID=29760 RepID=A0A438C5L5_VITVI|nr:hypothetical protein CK203_101319 [Vitis vinifera]